MNGFQSFTKMSSSLVQGKVRLCLPHVQSPSQKLSNVFKEHDVLVGDKT